MSFARKVKSLVQRWLTKPNMMAEGGSAFVDGDVLIERDVVILVSAKTAIVGRPHRVVDVCDKHCSKWLMTKSRSPVKR